MGWNGGDGCAIMMLKHVLPCRSAQYNKIIYYIKLYVCTFKKYVEATGTYTSILRVFTDAWNIK